MIAIVSYGSGNILAIANVYNRLGVPFTFASTPQELALADRVILPGVGAFDQAMAELNGSGMRRALDSYVADGSRPILGICVGMQLMGKSSEEGTAPGLGWIDAEVKRFDRVGLGDETRLPHMGWNSVEPSDTDALFDGVDGEAGYYFLHSYHVVCADQANELAWTEYGARFTSAIRSRNVFGVQFHPEKSHQNGVRLLQNFAGL